MGSQKIMLTPYETLTVRVHRPALVSLVSEEVGFDPRLSVEYQTVEDLRRRISDLERLNSSLNYELDRYRPLE